VSIDPRQRRGRLQLVLLFLVFLAPVVAAWLWFSLDSTIGKDETLANGRLVEPPRPLPPTNLRRISGDSFTSADLNGRWTLLYIDGTSCGDFCQQQLYNITQTHLALGKDVPRVQRMLLFAPESDAAAVSAAIARFDGFDVTATAEPDVFEAFVEAFRMNANEQVSDTGRTYIIDPLGNLMMYYPPGGDPKGMLRDLLRLLKASQVG
jgi:cytochrome oxidase Cu insertion factor (SCO1/SenC/PrrC family)